MQVYFYGLGVEMLFSTSKETKLFELDKSKQF